MKNYSQESSNKHTSHLHFSETGRYDPERENLEMMRVTCTDGATQNHLGPCAALCRTQTDNDLDKNTMKEVIYLIFDE